MTDGPAERVADIQAALRETPAIEGWLFYDFRYSDPLAYRVLLLDPTQHVTRRWYYWVPAEGEAIKIVHRIEPHTLDALPGRTVFYVSWQEQGTALQTALAGRRRIAMQYSPMNAVPYVSRVDAGTIDLMRSFGLEPVTSADLVQRFEAVWDGAQLASHRAAAESLRRIVDEAFGHIREMTLAARMSLNEYGLQQFIVSRLEACGLTTSSAPIVAVNAHSADPHYSPGPQGSSEI
jgi:Xaa-Pro dipeptidase